MAPSQKRGRKNQCDLQGENSQGTDATGWLVHGRGASKRERRRGWAGDREKQRNRGREREREGKEGRGREKRHKACDLTKEGRYQRQVRNFICFVAAF